MAYETPSTHLSFDVWKTLIKSNPEYKPLRTELIADGLGVKSDEAFHRIIRKVDVDTDKLSDVSGIQYGGADRVGFIADALEISIDDKTKHNIADAAQQLFIDFPPFLNEPGLIQTLGKLSAEKMLCITSNTGFIDGAYMRQGLEEIGVLQHFDTHFFSNEVGVAKPHPEMFAQVADWAGHTATLIHVGDNFQADYLGALNNNIRAVLLAPEPRADVVSAPTISAALEQGLL